MPGRDVLPRVRQRFRTTWQGLPHPQRDRGPAEAGPYRSPRLRVDRDVLLHVRQRVRTTQQTLAHPQRDHGPAAAGPYRVGLWIWMDVHSFGTD